jgi:hypothetical protein
MTRYVTARHCIEKNDAGIAGDIILLDELPKWAKLQDLTDATIHRVSQYTPETVNGKTLTLKAYLPDMKIWEMIPYQISGKAIHIPEIWSVALSVSGIDIIRILQSAWRSCRDGSLYISGMSGGTILDDRWDYYGPASQAHNICKIEESKDPTKKSELRIHPDVTYDHENNILTIKRDFLYYIIIPSLRSYLQKSK